MQLCTYAPIQLSNYYKTPSLSSIFLFVSLSLTVSNITSHSFKILIQLFTPQRQQPWPSKPPSVEPWPQCAVSRNYTNIPHRYGGNAHTYPDSKMSRDDICSMVSINGHRCHERLVVFWLWPWPHGLGQRLVWLEGLRDGPFFLSCRLVSWVG